MGRGREGNKGKRRHCYGDNFSRTKKSMYIFLLNCSGILKGTTNHLFTFVSFILLLTCVANFDKFGIKVTVVAWLVYFHAVISRTNAPVSHLNYSELLLCVPNKYLMYILLQVILHRYFT